MSHDWSNETKRRIAAELERDEALRLYKMNPGRETGEAVMQADFLVRWGRYRILLKLLYEVGIESAVAEEGWRASNAIGDFEHFPAPDSYEEMDELHDLVQNQMAQAIEHQTIKLRSWHDFHDARSAYA